jgi:predicted nuclease of predicted toxin-antitoxin system
MPGLRFLADIHISPATIRELRDRGWDIVRVSDVLEARSSDAEILEYAGQHGQIVVTQDLDFSALLAIGGHAGPSVITLRLEDARPVVVTRRLLDVVSALEQELSEGVVVSADETRVRYRFLPILGERD